jgi:SAM-dependent methyltransferase
VPAGGLTAFGKATRFVRREGIGNLLRELSERLLEFCHERWLGIDTRGFIPPEALGYGPDLHEYAPIRYGALYPVLRTISARPPDGSFLDYGAGKGRAVAVAATFPFRRVIGVELTSTLLEAARRNVGRMRRRRAEAVELVQTDARHYVVPADVTVIHFFNPFQGPVLEAVADRIRESYERSPREVQVVYFNDDKFAPIVASQAWLRRIHQERVYGVFGTQQLYTCGVYVTAPLRGR